MFLWNTAIRKSAKKNGAPVSINTVQYCDSFYTHQLGERIMGYRPTLMLVIAQKICDKS